MGNSIVRSSIKSLAKVGIDNCGAGILRALVAAHVACPIRLMRRSPSSRQWYEMAQPTCGIPSVANSLWIFPVVDAIRSVESINTVLVREVRWFQGRAEEPSLAIIDS